MDLSLFGISVEADRWQDKARCRTIDNPDRFFPERGVSGRSARNLCGKCPVKSECLNYALEHEIEWGIWGGMTDRQRKKVKSARVHPARTGVA